MNFVLAFVKPLKMGLLLYNKNKIKKYTVSLRNNKNPLKTLTY